MSERLLATWREAARSSFDPGQMSPLMAEAFREVAANGAGAALRAVIEYLLEGLDDDRFMSGYRGQQVLRRALEMKNALSLLEQEASDV